MINLMSLKVQVHWLLMLAIAIISGCSGKRSLMPQFELLTKDETGLDFNNEIIQSPEFNVFNYMYFFNGGGIAVGDFNNDGLTDLFFSSNMGENKMFLNEGDFHFVDITEKAGMTGMKGWTSGATIVDINNDGLLDIYVSQVGDYQILKGKNQLYVCQQIKNGYPVYQDQAREYGLDLVGFSTQASFFDYDLDGDLDMFQLNHSLHQNGTFGKRKTFEATAHPLSGDKLMRNDNGKFVDVTTEAGINSSVIGYGLGIVNGDINGDGWPDIYIGNDFHENDYLYINQQDGTFKEVLTEQMMHTSRFSMGVDIGDINNDGNPDLISLDMLPYDPHILKSSLGEDGYDIFQFKLGHGYNHQYARNNLQLNNGNGTFSEIAQFSGIHATDWSWAPLFLDFDHDGYQDLFISNGIPRRMNDIDYINFRMQDEDINRKSELNRLEESDLEVVEKMPRIKLSNRFFRNNKNLQFEYLEDEILNDLPTFSNGASYADLDNDGDLDIVVNNIEDEPFVYKNYTVENARPNSDFLALKFLGSSLNIHGLGTKVLVFKQGALLTSENYPVRGYQSNVQPGAHIGVGDSKLVDSVLVIWPDLSYQKITAPKYNQIDTINWQPGLPKFDFDLNKQKTNVPINFVDKTDSLELKYRHKENRFVEFNRESLIPNMVSSEGPALAVGDVNGDGLEDVYIGASKRKTCALFLQNQDGKFELNTPLALKMDSIYEDVDAAFIDIENDGDLDLVVASGGNEYSGTSDYLKQRAYINDGTGEFERQDLFKGVYMTAACVLPADVNNDGYIDLFFGGRAVPKNYGKIPESYLFINKKNGEFDEVTDQYHDQLKKIGLVKDGNWADIDQDGDPDLILAVEWEPVKIFINNLDSFSLTNAGDQQGWWNFVLPFDFDQDGDLDIVAGNVGKNSRLKPNTDQPLRMYVEDFDGNGQIEQILTYFLGGREIPFASYAELTGQMVSLKKKYLYASDLAQASVEDLFGKEKLRNARIFEANNLASGIFENTGAGSNFTFRPLPDPVQWSTLEAGVVHDFGPKHGKQILLGGNFYDCNIEMGRYDANFGNLVGFKNGNFELYPFGDLTIKGQVRRIEAIEIAGVTHFIMAKNNAELQIIQPMASEKPKVKVELQ